MGAQKNRLIETVLLSTHNICFGNEIRKIIFNYAHLSGGLHYPYVSACFAGNTKIHLSGPHDLHLSHIISFSFVPCAVSLDSSSWTYSVILWVCLLRSINKKRYGFPPRDFSTFFQTCKQEMKCNISDIMLWKNIKCVMLILFSVHDTH